MEASGEREAKLIALKESIFNKDVMDREDHDRSMALHRIELE